MARIAVTGAKGFLGRNVALALQTKHQVIGIGRREGDLVVDLSRGALPWGSAELRRADVLVHAAAVIRTEGSAVSENVEIATNAILHMPARLKAIILISSTSVYAPSHEVINETTAPKPYEGYGFAKLAIERLFYCFAQAAGAPLIILRPCSIYGHGDPHKKAITIFAENIRCGEPLRLTGNATMGRDYLHVEDAARAVALGVDAGLRGQSGLFNVCTGNALSPFDIANILCELAERAPIVAPAGSHPEGHFRFDPSHTRSVIGFEAEIPIRRGLADLIAGPRNI